MKVYHSILILVMMLVNITGLFAQEINKPCKVLNDLLDGKYIGECKKGLANGKGEATGVHHYIGSFKNGLPDGKGIYYYSDSMYHSGNFQDGIKEGKGETHYIKNGLPDSIIKGYWSADEYRGRQYTTYKFSCSQNSDLITEITPSAQSGNSITIEISTTISSPNGAPSTLTVRELISTEGDFVKKISNYATTFKTSVTYQLNKFPAKLFASLSDGRTFEIELYKAATWTVKLFINR